VKSKRWPLGVKQLLDINAPPPSEAEGEGVGDGDAQDLRYGKNYRALFLLSLLCTVKCMFIVSCFQLAVRALRCGVKLNPLEGFFSEVVGNELV